MPTLRSGRCYQPRGAYFPFFLLPGELRIMVYCHLFYVHFDTPRGWMSLFLVSKRFGREAHQVMCENRIFTEVALPWDVAFSPKDFGFSGGVRFVRRMPGSSTPTYCTLTIRLASSFVIKSFLMLVNFAQLEMFVRWCAIALTVRPGGLRDFEHIIRYHQPQLPNLKKAGLEMGISSLLKSRWFGFRHVALEGFGDDARSALETVRDYPWASYNHFHDHILHLHKQSVRIGIHAFARALDISIQALDYIRSLGIATGSKYARETWLRDWRSWQWRDLLALVRANTVIALWHVLVRDVKILCFSRRDERLYEATLRRAQHTLDAAMASFSYSVQHEGPDKIDARRDFCMIAVLTCLILDRPALRQALYQKGKGHNLPMTEYKTSPMFKIVSPDRDPYKSMGSMMNHIFSRYRPREVEQPTVGAVILGPNAVRPGAAVSLDEIEYAFGADEADTLDTTDDIDGEDEAGEADDADEVTTVVRV